MTTDYDRIGGGPAVGAVVEDLYRRLTADEQATSTTCPSHPERHRTS